MKGDKKLLWRRLSFGWIKGDDPDFKWEYSSDRVSLDDGKGEWERLKK